MRSFPGGWVNRVEEEIPLKKALKEQGALGKEILQEMAEALGNSGERLERAIAILEESSAKISSLMAALERTSSERQRRKLEEKIRAEAANYNHLRKEALEQLRWLIIHREALGMRSHGLVAEKYKIPPPFRF